MCPSRSDGSYFSWRCRGPRPEILSTLRDSQNNGAAFCELESRWAKRRDGSTRTTCPPQMDGLDHLVNTVGPGPRDLATSPVEPSSFHLPISRVTEMREFNGMLTLSPANAHPPVDHAVTRISTLRNSRILMPIPRDFSQRDPEGFCHLYSTSPLCYGHLSSNGRNLATSQTRDSRGQFLGYFLTRLRCTIPRADPTAVLFSLLAPSRLGALNVWAFPLRTSEFARTLYL
jgi:hypothetical protein